MNDRCTFQFLLRQADTADPAVTVAAVQHLLDRFSERPSVQYLEDAASLIQRLIDAHRMQNSGVSTSPPSVLAQLGESFRD